MKFNAAAAFVAAFLLAACGGDPQPAATATESLHDSIIPVNSAEHGVPVPFVLL